LGERGNVGKQNMIVPLIGDRVNTATSNKALVFQFVKEQASKFVGADREWLTKWGSRYRVTRLAVGFSEYTIAPLRATEPLLTRYCNTLELVPNSTGWPPNVSHYQIIDNRIKWF